jgi:hypothetical protein
VKFEQIGSVSYVTWDGVVSYGTNSPATFQLQFDRATGNVTYAWGAVALAGNEWLVGFAAPPVHPASAGRKRAFLGCLLCFIFLLLSHPHAAPHPRPCLLETRSLVGHLTHRPTRPGQRCMIRLLNAHNPWPADLRRLRRRQFRRRTALCHRPTRPTRRLRPLP